MSKINKEEFLHLLRQSLSELPEQERKDILYDYEEHFSVGLVKGKTEPEICNALGDPKTIANQFKVGYMIQQAEKEKTPGNVFKAIFTALSLGFFNLIFLLIPFIVVVAVLLSLFAAASAITLVGLVCLIALVIPGAFPFRLLSMTTTIAGVFITVGTIAMGLLLVIGVVCLGKLFFSLTISYIKWNLNVIMAKSREGLDHAENQY